MKKLLLLVALALLILPVIVSAEISTLGTFKQNTCVSLIQTCGNCTFNNVSSVLYPNSSKAITNQIMTKSGSEYNLTFCTTLPLGEYIVNGIGNPDGAITAWAYNFFITPSGTVDDSLAQLILIGGAALLAMCLIWFGLQMKDPVFATFGCLILIPLGLYLLINGIGAYRNNLTEAISFIVIFVGAYIGARAWFD